MAKAPEAPAGADTALVKALADILDDAGLAELEYETEAVTVRLAPSSLSIRKRRRNGDRLSSEK